MATAAQKYYSSRIHPQKFALWIAMASISMMFIAFVSAYIVRQAQGNWLEFSIPTIFYVSTGIIVLSSVLLHISYSAFKKGNEWVYKSMLILSFLLGIGFLVCQFQGWNAMYGMEVYMNGNPSGSFFYLISMVHAAHIVGGIGAMLVALLHAFTLAFKPTEKRRVRFQLVLHYWHFVDFLWIYLFIFLLMTR